MSDKKLDIPSNCPSPARIEKTDSSSSRHSGSPPNWEFESFIISDPSCREGRTRRSSWDESDDASSPELERCVKPRRLYSSDAKKFRGSVTAEINELKKQFFQSIEKLKNDSDNWELENLREITSNDDRRQSPARVRRRTKSSSSSSPVMENRNPNSPENVKKLKGPEAKLEEISSNILELDPKLYLNNFFTELRTKRISMIESTGVTEEGPIYDSECIQEYNNPYANEDGVYFCKTSRKLSQILEVEESKKDSEENGKKSKDFSPLQTARSKKSENVLERFPARKPPGNFKSMSFEHFRQLGKPLEGSLTERTNQTFGYTISDFLSLSAKAEKIKMTSPKWLDGNDDNNPLQFVCLSNAMEANTNVSRESTPKNGNSTSRNPTSRRSADRSDRSRTTKKSIRSPNPVSPKFTINLGKDSERSLKIEDVTTPDSQRKEMESIRKSSSSDSKTEINLDSLGSKSRSSKEQDMNHSRSSASTQRSRRRREKQRKSDWNDESETARQTAINSGRSYANSHRSEFSMKPEMNFKSNRSPKPTSVDHLSDEGTPRSDKEPELSLLLERPDSQKASYRSVRIELGDVTKESDRSGSKQRSPRSGRSFSFKSMNTMSRKSTPRGVTPMTTSSSRSKDSLEDRDIAESLRTVAWKELEKACDTLSNRTSVSSDSSNVWKKPETLIHQETFSPEPMSSDKNSDPRPVRSRKSSGKSVNSLDAESSDVVSVADVVDTQDAVSENNAEVLVNEDAEETQRSEKRLSIIDEVSFEDLETSNEQTERVDDPWEKSTKAEKTPRMTPRVVSLKEKPLNELVPQPDSGRWNDLIEKFSQSPTNPNHKEGSGSSCRVFEENEADENSDKSSTKLMERQNESVGTKMEENEDLKTPEEAYKEPLLGNIINEKGPHPVQSPQNLFYMNIDKVEPFGIGEFGDVACWSAGKSDTADSEKPKDHGDGLQTTEVLIIPEKREKEAKTQRQLWTELKEDFRISNKLEESGLYCELKTPKSDISTIPKTEDENEGRLSPIYAFSNDKHEMIEKKLLEFENLNLKEPSKNTASSESLVSEKDDSDNLEFDTERTPRLSRSLSNLDTCENKESKAGLNTSETRLFQKTSQNEGSTNLSIFLASDEKNKMAAKPNNWLSITGEKTHKRNGKTSNRKRKDSSKKSSREYLSSRKTVPKIKLRNSNCFQNFYKRFISVFCLTSHSSAAMSK